ncbi:MAG TPA: hypothetical protein PLZ78_10530 [Spirochaetota bacterium]|nr:hypothetical protein [Spirochaetota bacterium]
MRKILVSLLFVILVINKSNSNEYYKSKIFVVGDNVNLRMQPTIEAQVMESLKLAQEVELKEKKAEKVIIDGKAGSWVYVDTHSRESLEGDTIKGWVFDYYLAGIDKFKKVTKFRESKINTMVGDTLIYYEFLKDGSYRRKIREIDEYSRVLSVKIEKGHLFRYRDVVLAMDADKHYEVFYVTDKGFLCSSVYSNADGFVCSH